MVSQLHQWSMLHPTVRNQSPLGQSPVVPSQDIPRQEQYHDNHYRQCDSPIEPLIMPRVCKIGEGDCEISSQEAEWQENNSDKCQLFDRFVLVCRNGVEDQVD